jgi:hypothetical protein
MKLLGLVRALALVLFSCRCAIAASFQATPLMDFRSGEKYLGVFSGLLYDNSNTLATSDPHGRDGLAFASKVQPLNAQGQPSSTGKIVVVGIGQSVWTMDLCTRVTKTETTLPACTAASFIATEDPVDNPKVRVVDCASGGQVTTLWVNNNYGNWSRCDGLLANEGLTPAQVQVILFHDVNDLGATVSLSPNTTCSTVTTLTSSTPDACGYIRHAAEVARFAKTWFPHIEQMFLNSSYYNGYVSGHEPFSYENGFGVKWLIKAQMDQISSGSIKNLDAGDLSYTKAPWLAWGDYIWASGATPRSDGLTWLTSDYLSDLIHPSQSGVLKDTHLMMNFYFTSPYTAWMK